jgi:hypothetical protein
MQTIKSLCQRKQFQPLHFVKFPIYSVEVFDNSFVYLGGGGGNEIANLIWVFQITEGCKQLGEPIHKEETGDEVAHYLQASKTCNMLAACLTNLLYIYKIEKNG